MTCTDATMSLGVYLVGALEPAERAEVEAHLATCHDCQRQLDELAALPSMLDLLRLEDVEVLGSGPQAAALGVSGSGSAITPPEDLFERFAAKARDADAGDELSDRRERKTRFTRFRVITSAAAAVVVIGGGIGIGVAAGGSGHHHTQSNVFDAVDGSVHMHIALASQTTGTSMDLEVSGLPDDEHCQLIAVGKDGTRDLAGQWNATYSGKAKFWGSTSISRSDLQRVVLLGTNGKPLVTALI